MTPRRHEGNNRQSRGQKAYRDGISREAIAALILRCKFYRILGTRLRTPFGEVDILAEKNGTLVIVEVKARAGMDQAAEAIHPAQRMRLMNAAQHLAARLNKGDSVIRMDAFLFGAKALPRHIKNAF